MKTKLSSKKQQGFTFIELMGVLLLIGILGTIAAQKYSSAALNTKISTVQGDISALYAAASRFKGISPTYTGVTCEKLVTDKYHDTNWTNCNGVNPFAGNYTVAPNASVPASVDITAIITDQAACRRLAATYSKIYTSTCSGSTLSVTFTQ